MEYKDFRNRVFCCDCLEFMRGLPECCIDLVMTSPPYAEQRKGCYNGIPAVGYPEWFSVIALEIFRVLKPSGSFVLNIKEHAEQGRRNTYVLRTVLALSEIFLWNDTFIWNKPNAFPTGNPRRLKDGFEYCYLFTKTQEYKFNPDAVLVPSINDNLEAEKRRNNRGRYDTSNGSELTMHKRVASDLVRPSNVLSVCSNCCQSDHPASFPLALPEFFLKLLTDAGDIVYDPFAGSGTTLLAGRKLGREFVGTEIEPKYAELIQMRLDEVTNINQLTLF